MKTVADSLKTHKVETSKIEINPGILGFFSGFFGFAGWSFFGNISSTDNQRMSLYNYLIGVKDSVLLSGSGLKTRDAEVSLVESWLKV